MNTNTARAGIGLIYWCFFNRADAWFVLKVELTNIKFNWDAGSSAIDAINIRQDYTHEYDISNGEWVKDGTNIPVCYTTNKAVTIKARFTVQPASIDSADIWAISVGSGGSLGDVFETNVTFSGGVSVGDAAGYVEFKISGTTPNCVKKTMTDLWAWKMENVNESGSPEWDLNTSGVHTVYTILNEPTSPWGNSAGNQKNAWTTILDYSCDWAATATDEANTVAKITTGANSGFGKIYDGSQTHTPGNMSHLSAMVAGSVVDCRDMSGVVELFTRILGGATVQFRRVDGPFYYKRILPIGSSTWGDGGWNFHQFGWHADSVNDACVHLKESEPYVPVHDDLNGNYKTNLFDSGTWSPLTPDTITDID